MSKKSDFPSAGSKVAIVEGGDVHEALVVSTRGDRLNLAVTRGPNAQPVMVLDVPRRASDGDGWCPSSEAPKRTLSPAEELAAASARGERVPRVGDTVTYLRDDGDNLTRRLVPYRAAITRVHSVTKVDLEVFLSDRPEADERPILRDYQVGQGDSAGRWAWPNAIPLTRSFDPVRWEECYASPCPLCKKPIAFQKTVEIRSGNIWSRVCPDCGNDIATEIRRRESAPDHATTGGIAR